jgi:hypothetical protein
MSYPIKQHFNAGHRPVDCDERCGEENARKCPCCFVGDGTMKTFSFEWYEAHALFHIAAFPDVDDVTRHNLWKLAEYAFVETTEPCDKCGGPAVRCFGNRNCSTITCSACRDRIGVCPGCGFVFPVGMAHSGCSSVAA